MGDAGEVLPNPWVQCLSDDGPYYFNEDTGESQWERPGEAADDHEKSDAETNIERGGKKRRMGGHFIEILDVGHAKAPKRKFSPGEILEVVGKTCSGAGFKVASG